MYAATAWINRVQTFWDTMYIDKLHFLFVCLFVYVSVCLSVCLFAPRYLRGLNSYDHEIWHVGPLSDLKSTSLD